jgi:hypothetical protein
MLDMIFRAKHDVTFYVFKEQEFLCLEIEDDYGNVIVKDFGGYDFDASDIEEFAVGY